MIFETPQTLASICSLIQAKAVGNGNFPIKGINEIHMVAEGDITFVDFEKYYNTALTSKASVIIIDKEVECPDGKCLLVSENPFRDYNFLTQYFRPLIQNSNASYHIGEHSAVGKNTYIHKGAVIGNHVTIGDNCIIYPNVVIYDHCVIGNNVIIHANTSIGGDAFYYKRLPGNFIKMHSCGRAILHDWVEVGCNTTIDRGVSGDTVIGRGTKIDNLVQIGHDNQIGENCIIAAQCGIAGVTKLEDGVVLWGQVGVNKDITIGAGAVLMGKAGATKNLAGGKTYSGNPAKEHRQALIEMATISRLTKQK